MVLKQKFGNPYVNKVGLYLSRRADWRGTGRKKELDTLGPLDGSRQRFVEPVLHLGLFNRRGRGRNKGWVFSKGESSNGP